MAGPALHVVLLAGGAGTRLWPLSTPEKPKQFLRLAGGGPLLSETFERVRSLTSPERTFVSTRMAYAELVRKVLPEIPERNLILEPVSRNTGPALALAVAVLESRMAGSDVVAFLPSDQWVTKPGTFRADLGRAVRRAARTGEIVTLGVAPDRPETGFGYLKPAAGFSREGILDRFVEKPDRANAARFLRAGYLWNAGIFVATADALGRAFDTAAPGLLDGARRAEKARSRGAKAFGKAYAELPALSFDHAVAERAERISVVATDSGWSDLGSFEAIRRIGKPDRSGNVVIGDATVEECSGCLVLADGIPVVAKRQKNLVVAGSGTGVLVRPMPAGKMR